MEFQSYGEPGDVLVDTSAAMRAQIRRERALTVARAHVGSAGDLTAGKRIEEELRVAGFLLGRQF